MSQDQEFLCTVCLGSYNDTNVPMKLNRCQHIFHQSCIEKWNETCADQNTDFTCPACRETFDINKLTVQSSILKQKTFNEFQVILKTTENQTKIINVDSKMTVKQFTDLVYTYTYIKPEQCHFSCNGKGFSVENHSDKLLTDININKNSTIFLLLRLNGG